MSVGHHTGQASLQPLIRAAMAVLQAAGGQMNITLLNKMLFYWDLHSLLETGSSITGVEYLAMRQGPVVASYERRICKALAKAGLAEEAPRGQSKPLRVKQTIDVALSPIEQALLAETFALAKKHDWTSTKASEYSHQNPGWILAWQETQRHHGSAQPIEMGIAVQQLGEEDDDWLDAPLSDDERQRLESEAKELTHPWN